MYFHRKKNRHTCNCGLAPYQHLRGCYCYKWLFFINYSMSRTLRRYQWKLKNLYNIAIEKNRRINFLLKMLSEYEYKQYNNTYNKCPNCKENLNPFCTYEKSVGHRKSCKLKRELNNYEKDKKPIEIFHKN